MYGKNFSSYQVQGQSPYIVAMIENKAAVEEISAILSVDGLDAVLVGPYDLSASLGCTGQFECQVFKKALETIMVECKKKNIPYGIHIVEPKKGSIDKAIASGNRFLAHGIDAVFLLESLKGWRQK